MDQPTLFGDDLPPMPPEPKRPRTITAESAADAPTPADLADACAGVLCRTCTPTRLKDLVAVGWIALGWPLDPFGKDKRTRDAILRSRENLRQIALIGSRARAGQHVTGHHGLCYAGLMRIQPSFVCRIDWFDGRVERKLFNDDNHVEIPVKPRAAARAVRDAERRTPYMLNKHNVQYGRRVRNNERTFSAQHAVQDYLAELWPGRIFDATNVDDEARPSADDFRIKRANGAFWKVDVAARNRTDGRFGGFRKGWNGERADCHILVDVDDGKHKTFMIGFATPEQFERGIDELETSPISRLTVWMNCDIADVSYSDLERWTRQTQDDRGPFVPPPRRSYGREVCR